MRQTFGPHHAEIQATRDRIVELHGTEDAPREVLEELREVDGETKLVMLTDRYYLGWRH